MTIGMLHPSAQLLRGFACDFLTAHNADMVERIMDPEYTLRIGGYTLTGRDDVYLPATAAQLAQFPGLCVTVHDTIIGNTAIAMRFTEHGVSSKHSGRLSTWGGVTLFQIENGRLRRGWAEEDYFARKRQLASGLCDAIKAPHPAPWDVPCKAPDAATEAVARAWLADPAGWTGIDEISAEGPRFGELVAISDATISHLFTAGQRGAFHMECKGSYMGGFDDIDPAKVGQPAVLRLAGLFTVEGGSIVNVQICADRLGLHRSLLGPK